MSSTAGFRRLLAEYERQLAEARRTGRPGQVRKAEAKVRSTKRRLERAEAKEAAAREKQRATMAQARPGLGRQGKGLATKRAMQRKPPQGPPKPRKPLQAHKPMPAVNPVRKAKMREEQFSIKDGYRAYIVAQPCIRCQAPPPVDPMHVLGVDLGGKAADMLPGCRKCHTWQEVNKKQFEREFEDRYGMHPLEMARAMRAAYLLDNQGEQADDE